MHVSLDQSEPRTLTRRPTRRLSRRVKTAPAIITLPPSPDVSQALTLPLSDAQGRKHTLDQIFNRKSTPSPTHPTSTKPHRVLLLFTRHFLCNNCQEYLRHLSSHPSFHPTVLSSQNIRVVVIGCGASSYISSYRALSRLPEDWEVYTDPTTTIYKTLGMVRTLNLGETNPGYLVEQSLARGMVRSAWQGVKRLPSGDVGKAGGFDVQGGEYLFAYHRRGDVDNKQKRSGRGSMVEESQDVKEEDDATNKEEDRVEKEQEFDSKQEQEHKSEQERVHEHEQDPSSGQDAKADEETVQHDQDIRKSVIKSISESTEETPITTSTLGQWDLTWYHIMQNSRDHTEVDDLLRHLDLPLSSLSAQRSHIKPFSPANQSSNQNCHCSSPSARQGSTSRYSILASALAPSPAKASTPTHATDTAPSQPRISMLRRTTSLFRRSQSSPATASPQSTQPTLTPRSTMEPNKELPVQPRTNHPTTPSSRHSTDSESITSLKLHNPKLRPQRPQRTQSIRFRMIDHLHLRRQSWFAGSELQRGAGGMVDLLSDGKGGTGQKRRPVSVFVT